MDDGKRNGIPDEGKRVDQRKLVRQVERDPWNRLLSVQLDAEWVMNFCRTHVSRLPIVPNLRCGAWYVPPTADDVDSRGCYFKSTDGHTNEWGFSLKRYNPTTLTLVQERDGCVIVDSTRRGKSMPDALSKTIPIWCAVINEASQKLYSLHWTCTEEERSLCLPKHVVSPSEAAQIQRRIVDWVDDLLDSDLEVPKLAKPLRPVFVSRSFKDVNTLRDVQHGNLTYLPIVLVSASPMTPTPDIVPRTHECVDADVMLLSVDDDVLQLRRKAKFVYVQGSGDDEEMWSSSLTPRLLWSKDNLRAILATQGDREVLNDCIQTIHLHDKMARTTLNEAERGEQDVRLGTNFNIWFGKRATTFSPSPTERKRYRLIIHCDGTTTKGDEDERQTNGEHECTVMHLGIENGKRGLHAFRQWIPDVIAASRRVLPDGAVLLCSAEGDGIGHDLNAGLAVCILACCFRADKSPLSDRESASLSKEDVQKRLQWITTLVPHAKPPSRKHMLRINEALLSQTIRAEIEERRRRSQYDHV